MHNHKHFQRLVLLFILIITILLIPFLLIVFGEFIGFSGFTKAFARVAPLLHGVVIVYPILYLSGYVAGMVLFVKGRKKERMPRLSLFASLGFFIFIFSMLIVLMGSLILGSNA